ncbi:BPSL0067 family protein [Arenicella xantha]|uniref:CHAP domain-containing protein n=1 Tax=Arenicella xantha TaxID=644221 RepID=A0A395JJB1_9GAMM|nr:BPSL0067 family protein [Arenicella xantha]RBP50812.1 hypothetical protein DFR28_102228 [Arenicella xantha]
MNESIEKIRKLKAHSTLITALLLSTLTACVSNHLAEKTRDSGWLGQTQLHCTDAHTYRGRVVGDGHCVSLIKRCSGAPNTDQWLPGEPVLDNTIQPGTIIATFKNDRYPSTRGHHAAIYIEQDDQGIWVWDQWVGKPVHRRLIRLSSKTTLASNTAGAYRVVTVKR